MRLPRCFPPSARVLVLGLALLLVAAAPRPQPAPPVVLPLDPTGTNRALALAYSPDGRLLAVGTATGLALYDTHTQTELRFIPSDSWVRSVAFSPDGLTLAAGSYAPEVRLWRVADGTLLRTLTGHTSWVRSLVFSPDGATLLTASDDQTVRWWRVADGAPLRTLADGLTGVRVLALSPDGATLAAGGADGQVRLLRAADGALLHTLAGHTDWIRSLAFSPDGHTLASGAFDATARLWRVSDGAPLFELRGHTFSVLGVAFAPDGLTLATGSVDARVTLWRVADGTRLRVLAGHTGFIYAVAYAPDGLTLASAAADNTVRLWPVTPAETPQTDNVPVVPSTSCVECHHPRGDYLLPGGQTESPPVLDVACAACHSGGTLVLHWCPAFPRSAGVTERHGTFDTLANQVGFPRATRTLALALASPGNGEHYYVPAIHTVLPVSGQLFGANTAGLPVTLEVWSNGERTGLALTHADASGHFFFSTDLRPGGIVLEVPIEQRECALCHSETLAATPALPPGDVRLVVSAVGADGQTVTDERWITVDRSHELAAAVTVVAERPGEALPPLTVQASTRLYGWRGRQFAGVTDAAGLAHFNVEVLAEVDVVYEFQIAPMEVDGRLYASLAPVVVTVTAGSGTLPPVTLTVASQPGQITGRVPPAVTPLTIHALHLPEGTRYDAPTTALDTFSFPDLPLGPYLVLADPAALAAQGLTSPAQTVDLGVTPLADLTLTTSALEPGALTAEVTDETGRALPFAWVSSGLTDPALPVDPATGAVTLRGAWAATHHLVATAPGYYSLAVAVPAGASGPVSIRLEPQPALQRLAWGTGFLNVPADTTLTGSGASFVLASGWLWGQGAGGAPVVIEAAGVLLTISDGPFALVSRPGQPAWLYLLGGRAEAYRVGQPAAVTALAANTMLALTAAGPLTAVPLDPLVIAALPRTSAAPAPAWAPTLAAQLNNRLALAGITAAQVVTFVTYMGVLIALFAVPIVRLSWWLRKRKSTGRLAHV